MFKNPFSFEGRIRRLEYGLSLIIGFVYVIFLFLVFASSSVDSFDIIIPFAIMLMLPYFWFIWAQGAKRCHDLGNNGWTQLIPLEFFDLFFDDSVKGPNKYGDNPKNKVVNTNINYSKPFSNSNIETDIFKCRESKKSHYNIISNNSIVTVLSSSFIKIGTTPLNLDRSQFEGKKIIVSNGEEIKHILLGTSQFDIVVTFNK
ncbi:DUF805 domain-containing protein [Lutibacter holmesii]|uniref:DUF805 domain-containing protein n=1 Tax=Lutibacter holmesii TaxID=1137985 RepID=A0ABW3WNY5_9FLAO